MSGCWRGSPPPDCCCAWGEPGPGQGAAPRVAKQTGSCALCRRQGLQCAAFVAPAEPAVGAMLPAPPHSCLSAPRRGPGPCRQLPDQAPSQWESLLSPPRSCCCSDLIPPLVGFRAAVPISVPFSRSLASRSFSLGSLAQQVFHGGFAVFSGDVGSRQTPQMFLGKRARDEGGLQSGKNYWRKTC